MIHYNYPSLSQDKTAKLVIRFEVRSFFSCGNFLNAATLLFRPSCTVPRVTKLTRVYYNYYNNVCIFISMYADSEMQEKK